MNNIMTSAITYGDISDHLLIFVIRVAPIEQSECVKNINDTKFIRDMSNFLLMSLIMTLQKSLINSICLKKYQLMKFLININLFLSTVNKHGPLKNLVDVKKELILKPWLTAGLIKSPRYKNRLFKKIITHDDMENINVILMCYIG